MIEVQRLAANLLVKVPRFSALAHMRSRKPGP